MIHKCIVGAYSEMKLVREQIRDFLCEGQNQTEEKEIKLPLTRLLDRPILEPSHHTVCPGSSDPFYVVSKLYKMGHYFINTQ